MQLHHLVLLSEVGQTLDAGPPFVGVISWGVFAELVLSP
jgi:hypothetical protein